MTKRYMLGIDVGTTGTKTILFSESGEAVAHAYRSYPLYNPALNHSEQEALDWWGAIVATVREVCCGVDKSAVTAISLSTQGGTVVPVDKDGNPLRRAIVWNDHRFASEREKYLSEIGAPETLYEKCGWKLGTGLPMLAIRYLRDNEPDVFSAADKFLSVPDFVALKMTGRAAVDLSNAGINELCDINKKAYDKTLLSFAGVGEERLAEIVSSGEVIGHLTASAAEALGLTESTLLVAGAHDQYAVSLGAGAVNPGDILIGSGTCWVVTAMGQSLDFSSGFAQSVAAVPGLYGTLRSLSTGGVCLEWLRKLLSVGKDELIDYGLINEKVAERTAAFDGLFFYPFSGVHPFKQGAFIGLDLSHDSFHMARAIMEGVVFEIVWMMEAFKTKPSKDGLKLAGGATKSEVWCQMLADVSGLPVRIPALADLACVGAAIIAGVGAKTYASAEDGYTSFAVSERVIYPRPEMTERYAPLLKKYKEIAAALGSAQ